MRDIWNPWHGCNKKSEGCQNCYMYYLDSQRGMSRSHIFRVKNQFDYPLQKNCNKEYKVRSGEFLSVCMTSDFFLKEADKWRHEAWEIMSKRPDVVFILVTKRPERIQYLLPEDWGDGWENIWLHVTCENQSRTDERVPILLDLPFKHKGIMVAPFIGRISLAKYLNNHEIENVWCGGENYSGARPLMYEWVKLLSDECKQNDVSFAFYETGNIFIKNGKKIITKSRSDQMKLAYSEGLNYDSTKAQIFNIAKSVNFSQIELFQNSVHENFFRENCKYCVKRKYCAGCSNSHPSKIFCYFHLAKDMNLFHDTRFYHHG